MNAVSVIMIMMSLLPVTLSHNNVLQRRWGQQVMYRTPFTDITRIKSNKVKHHHIFCELASAILV